MNVITKALDCSHVKTRVYTIIQCPFRTPNWMLSVLIFGTVFLLHTMSSVVTSMDSKWTIHTAFSLIRERDADLDEYRSVLGNDYAIEVIKGTNYTWYPIGVSIAAVPHILLIDRFSRHVLAQDLYNRLQTTPPTHEFPGMLERFVAAFYVAATTLVLYFAFLICLSKPYAIFLGLAFAFGTSAWSTASRALWQHGPSMFCLAIALYLVLYARKKPWLVVPVGMVLAASYTIRPTNAITIVILSVYIGATHRRYIFPYLFLLLLSLLPFLIYNIRTYDAFLPPYYQANRVFAYGTFGEAILGNVVSPARGLFIFSPFLVFIFVSVFLKIRRNTFNALDFSLMLIILSHWFVISSFPWWWAGWSFGPRFFTDMLPFLFYFLVPVMQSLHATHLKMKLIILPAVVLLFGAGVFINFRGANRSAVQNWNVIPNNIDENRDRLWDWRDPPFLRGVR